MDDLGEDQLKKAVDMLEILSYNIKLCDSVSKRRAKSPGGAFEMIENKSCENP